MKTRQDVLNAGSYEEFRRAIEAFGCRDCPLASQRTRLVVDRGNPEAKVMLIGEAPGRDEDLTGKPFVGRAGKLLDSLLAEIGFDTNRDCLIANVLKCRPPNNRPPQKKEVDECLPYLLKQIRLVRPRLIALLGATALKHLMPDLAAPGLSGRVGKAFPYPEDPEIKVMVLYHPAYLLRSPGKKAVMMEHLKEFRKEWLKVKRKNKPKAVTL